MSGILALDCATICGWAFWKPGMEKPRAGTVRMPDTESMGVFGKAFLDWCVPFANLEGVTHIVIEAPIVVLHQRRDAGGEKIGGVRVNLNVIRRTLSLVSFAELAAVQIGATCSESVRSTVVKHFTGRGDGSREEMKGRCLVMCQKTGWNVKSEDAADALATLDHYCWNERLKTPWDCAPRAELFAKGTKAPTNSDRARATNMLHKGLSFDRDRG